MLCKRFLTLNNDLKKVCVYRFITFSWWPSPHSYGPPKQGAENLDNKIAIGRTINCEKIVTIKGSNKSVDRYFSKSGIWNETHCRDYDFPLTRNNDLYLFLFYEEVHHSYMVHALASHFASKTTRASSRGNHLCGSLCNWRERERERGRGGFRQSYRVEDKSIDVWVLRPTKGNQINCALPTYDCSLDIG